jgi:hypothetical protein
MSCSDMQSLITWELTVPIATGYHSFTTVLSTKFVTNISEPQTRYEQLLHGPIAQLVRASDS